MAVDWLGQNLQNCIGQSEIIWKEYFSILDVNILKKILVHKSDDIFLMCSAKSAGYIKNFF